MKGALDVHCELLARDVAHEIVRLPRIVLAVDELPEALGLPPESCLAVSVFEVDAGHVAVLAPVTAVVSPAAVASATGSALVRAASVTTVNEVTDFAAGLVAPLPLPADLPLHADVRCAQSAVVYTATGDAGTALGIRAADLLRVTGALVGELVRPPLTVVPGPEPVRLEPVRLEPVRLEPASGMGQGPTLPS